jgi:general stress protein 26
MTDHQSTFSDKNKRIRKFLTQKNVGILATVDPNNDPYAAAVYYAIDHDFDLFFTTKDKTKKTDNLRHNNHAMVVVFDEETQTTVQLRGVAHEVTDAKQAERIFENTLSAAQYSSESGIPPISKLDAGEYIAFVLKPVDVRMAVYTRPESGDYSELFEIADL